MGPNEIKTTLYHCLFFFSFCFYYNFFFFLVCFWVGKNTDFSGLGITIVCGRDFKLLRRIKHVICAWLYCACGFYFFFSFSFCIFLCFIPPQTLSLKTILHKATAITGGGGGGGLTQTIGKRNDPMQLVDGSR